MTNYTVVNRLPKPTDQDWSAQIDWIFDTTVELSDWSIVTRTSFSSLKKAYKKFVSETFGEKPVEIVDLWDALSLVEWRDYLLGRIKDGAIGGKTAMTQHNAVGQIMRQAYSLGITLELPINIGIPRDLSSQLTTDYTTAYDFDYLEAINAVLRDYILQAKKCIEPYVRKKTGRDPRMRDNAEIRDLGRHRRYGIEDDRGWRIWDNIIWYFENVFDCKVPHPQDFADADYDRFTNQVYMCWDDLEKTWERLGLASWHKKQHIIFALVFCLANETGLNMSSLKSLTTDCFRQEHELTRQPYLHYTKARSGGDKELHFHIFADEERLKAATPEDNEEGERSYLWLNETRSRRVKGIIDLLISLTADIRERSDFPQEYKNKLIIWLIPYGKGKRYACLDNISVMSLRSFANQVLKPKIVQEAIKRLKSKTPKRKWAQLEKDTRTRLESQSFTVGRFRATIATEMVKHGANLEEIQAFLGHASLCTTILYIRRNDLEMSFFRDMSNFLETIKKNAIENGDKKRQVDSAFASDPPSSLVYETGICHCLDPFNPSDNIKKAVGWQKGQACRMWNRCLFCDRILITVQSLPKLLAYRVNLDLTLSSQITIAAHKALPLLRALALIDAIIEGGIFTESELNLARRASETLDYDLLDMMLLEGLEKAQKPSPSKAEYDGR